MNRPMDSEEERVQFMVFSSAVSIERFCVRRDPLRSRRLHDALYDVPPILERWPDMHRKHVREALERYEDRYMQGERSLSRYLGDDPFGGRGRPSESKA